MSFSYRAKLSKKLNKCTYRPIWSEFCADPYIVIFGDENVNAKQAHQDSIKRINAIKNVLNSDSSPGSTSDNDPAPAPAPAPAIPKPAPTRRYRP